MTDGIIQEVCKAYHVNTYNYEYRATVNDINNLIARIQLELIEKINQYLNEYGITEHANAYPTHQIGAIREKLIGDNQE